MRVTGCTAVMAAAVMALGVSVSAQKTTPVHPGKGGSPHVKTAWVVDGANITIEYGQPALKGRTDEAVMPAGKPWRTGADEATVLVTDKALMLADNLHPNAKGVKVVAEGLAPLVEQALPNTG